MDQTLLICAQEKSFLDELEISAQNAGIKTKKNDVIPNLDEFETQFPEFILLDLQMLGEQHPTFLEEVSQKYPSISLYVLADSEFTEETLLLALESGAKGWIFKTKPEQIISDFLKFLEEKHFLKPSVSELILERFKSNSIGEGLLSIEDEILRQSARGLSPLEIKENLKLSDKYLSFHWESIRQKLNINAQAKKRIAIEEINSMLPIQAKSISSLPQKELKEPPLPADSAKPEELQLITFQLGHEEFAFQIADLQEIQRMLPLTPLPKVDSYIMGVVNLRGMILPILDLRIKLGIEVAPVTKQTRIVVVNVDKKIVGILVDSVNEVLRVKPSQLENFSPFLSSLHFKAIQSIITLENRLVLVLDLRKVLSRENQIREVSLQQVGG